MIPIKDWIKDWQFLVAVSALMVGLLGYLFFGDGHRARYGTISPRPVKLQEFCNIDSISAHNILQPLFTMLSQSDKNSLISKLCISLDSCCYNDISVGAWFLCPDSTSSVDSLTVDIRSKSSIILRAIVVGTRTNDINPILSDDSKSVTFELSGLAPGESLALLLINEGITEDEYVVSYPKGVGKSKILHISEPDPWESYLPHYVFFLMMGCAIALMSSVVLRKRKPHKPRFDFTIQDLKDMLDEH